MNDVIDIIVANLVREGINKHRARELAAHFVEHFNKNHSTIQAVSDEYNAWIKHHAAGHTYDDFLQKLKDSK